MCGGCNACCVLGECWKPQSVSDSKARTGHALLKAISCTAAVSHQQHCSSSESKETSGVEIEVLGSYTSIWLRPSAQSPCTVSNPDSLWDHDNGIPVHRRGPCNGTHLCVGSSPLLWGAHGAVDSSQSSESRLVCSPERCGLHSHMCGKTPSDRWTWLPVASLSPEWHQQW